MVEWDLSMRSRSGAVAAPVMLAKHTQGHRIEVAIDNSASHLRTSTNTFLSSIMATFFPRHWYRPCAKTRSFVFSILWSCSPDASSQRSGRYISASSPKTHLTRCTLHTHAPMFVPPGTNFPSNISPPWGTILAKKTGTGGHMRRPSLMQARR